MPAHKTRWRIVSEYLQRMRAIDGVINCCPRSHCTPAAIHAMICKIYPQQTKKATTELLLKHRKAGDLINPQWGVYKLSEEASEAVQASTLCPMTKNAPLAHLESTADQSALGYEPVNIPLDAIIQQTPKPPAQRSKKPTPKSFTINLHGSAKITYTGSLTVEFN